MQISLIGIYSQRSYKSFFLNSFYSFAPQVNISLEGKYLTTQFQRFSYLFTHIQQIPLINFKGVLSEIRPTFSFKCLYEKISLPNYVKFEGKIQKRSYTQYIFTIKYSNAVENRIKFESSFYKRKINLIVFKSKYNNVFKSIKLDSKYIFKVPPPLEGRITFSSAYLKIVKKILDIGSFEELCAFSLLKKSENKEIVNIGGVNLLKINIKTTNVGNVFGNIYEVGCFYYAPKRQLTGIDSPLTTFSILDTKNVGAYLFNVGVFSCVKKEVGGLISSYCNFVLRREIRDSKFSDEQFVFPIKFKNIEIKNYVQNFIFVDLFQDVIAKYENLFYFEKKEKIISYVLDLPNINLFYTPQQLFKYKISELEIEFIPVKSKEKNRNKVEIKLLNAFYFTFKPPTLYHLSDSINLNFSLNRKSNLSNYLQIINFPTASDVWMVDQLLSANLFDLSFSVKRIKDTYIDIYFSVSIVDENINTFDGNKFVINPHRYVFTSDKFLVYNVFITSSVQIIDISDNLEFLGNFFYAPSVGGFDIRCDFQLNIINISMESFKEIKFTIEIENPLVFISENVYYLASLTKTDKKTDVIGLDLAVEFILINENVGGIFEKIGIVRIK